MTKIHKKKIPIFKIIAGIFLFFIVDIITFVNFPLLNTLFLKITFGWIPFLKNNLSQANVDLEIILQAIIAILFLLSGGHFFCAWIYKYRTGKNWKKSWTFGGTISIIILFCVGVASAGILYFTEEIGEKGVSIGGFSYRYIPIYTNENLLQESDKDLRQLFYYSQRSQLLAKHLKGEFTGLLNYYSANFKYLTVLSEDKSLFAVIRYPSSNGEVLSYHKGVFLRFWTPGQHHYEMRDYRVLSLNEIIQSIEKGIVPDDKT
ncbi:hypothetical protein [Candidatus Uabimicrobium sp. HlEnr_7]|uniref:hypothetical protein n=1 Tax=Candidatus Uabimicrobium helgolandensis TaxID=3095367 RepID=UPI003558CA2A